jgi:tetratricopeptide (TPR) repeat protein
MDGLPLRHISFQGLPLVVSVVAAIALTAWLYAPGLQGSFVFDDFANLPALSAQGRVIDGPSLLRFLTAGKADPTGRPISMASFLIEQRYWPTNPFPFKRDNLLLHLLNGVLLAMVLVRLGTAIGMDSARARFAAAFGAAAWLLHPLFVSTVLYIVQREAMLPATFTLLALLAWLRGREKASCLDRLPTTVTAVVYLLTTVATLCKANGLLIPLLIVCLELTLPSTGMNTAQVRRWTYRSFGPVAAIVVVAFAWTALTSLGSPPIPVRGWSVGQRLLTEPAILLDYLARLTLVAPPASSLFHDAYPAATGLLSPWYTLPAMIACSGLIFGAFVGRRKFPVVAMAVLFFFAAHLMESSALSLELYFEHRNYMPALLLFWPIGVVIHRLKSATLRHGSAIVLLAIAAGMTYANVMLWADPVRQALVWARLEPDSPRAQAYAAQLEAGSVDSTRAIERIDAAAARFPSEPQVLFAQTSLHCGQGHVSTATVENVVFSLRTMSKDPGELLSRWLGEAVTIAVDRRCDGVTLQAVDAMVNAATENPVISALPGRRQDIAHVRGTLALAEGNFDDALRIFNAALAEDPRPAVALNQAAALGAVDRPGLGLRHLDYFETLPKPPTLGPASGMRWIHEWVLNRQGYWEHEISHLRGELQRHAKGQA